MKLMTIGVSPYLLTSEGRLNGDILKHLYTSGESVAGIVWAHDTTYFIPEENKNGTKQYYYEFEHKKIKHKIPIVPFQRGQEDVVFIYEVLNKFKPEMVITVGDYNDFLYMKAVKQFYSNNIKWVFILMGYTHPINENDRSLINETDGVLCTSTFSYKTVEHLYAKDNIEVCYVGCDSDVYNNQYRKQAESKEQKFRIMTCAKNLQVENAPMLMQVIYEIKEECPNIELYIHTNLFDTGDYDFELLKNRFDPDDEFIFFPDKYVSLIDGISDKEYVKKLNAADVFISIPMISSSGMCIFEAMACGCFPLMSDCGANRDIADMLSRNFSVNLNCRRSDFLVPCIKLLTKRESYLSICDPGELKNKILSIYTNIKNKEGYQEKLAEFTKKYSRADFLNKVSELMMKSKNSNEVICLETI